MKKIILFLTISITTFIITISFFGVNAQRKEEVKKDEVTTLNSFNQDDEFYRLDRACSRNLDPYDVMTYDIYGNENYYKYEDIAYMDNISQRQYDYSLRNYQEIDFDGRNLRDDDDDDDDPYIDYYYLPYSAICLVTSSFDTNNDGIADVSYTCSGTVVGPDVVLTTCEYTYNNTYGFPVSMTFAPGAYTNENGVLVKPFGEASLYSASMGSYHDTFDANDDWAIVKFNSNIGYNSGWLEVSYTGISNGNYLNACGHSFYNNTYEISDCICQVSNLQTYKFNHDCNISAPMAGSPILDIYGVRAYGIQCGPRVTINNVTYSQACKISNYMISWIQDAGGLLEFRIFSDLTVSSAGIDTGHAWLAIKNNSPMSVIIGKMSVSSGCSVSIGTWPRPGHWGIFYNYEHYLFYYNIANNIHEFVDHQSYKKNIFRYQWNANNNYVLSNDNWNLFDDCVDFAVDVWNTILPQFPFTKTTPIAYPYDLYNQIWALDDNEHNISVPGGENVGYYDGNTFVSIVS